MLALETVETEERWTRVDEVWSAVTVNCRDPCSLVMINREAIPLDARGLPTNVIRRHVVFWQLQAYLATPRELYRGTSKEGLWRLKVGTLLTPRSSATQLAFRHP